MTRSGQDPEPDSSERIFEHNPNGHEREIKHPRPEDREAGLRIRARRVENGHTVTDPFDKCSNDDCKPEQQPNLNRPANDLAQHGVTLPFGDEDCIRRRGKRSVCSCRESTIPARGEGGHS